MTNSRQSSEVSPADDSSPATSGRNLRIVAVESSSKHLNVALGIGGKIVLHEPLASSGEKTTSSALTPLLQRAVQTAGILPREVDIIAVTIGPGSFTSLRIGCMTAKTWAYATGCRIVAIPTHELIARQNSKDAMQRGCSRLWVLTDAQRKQLFATLYQLTASGIDDLRAIRVTSILEPAALRDLMEADDLVAGEGVRMSGADMSRWTDPADWSPRAEDLIELAAEKARRQEFADLWTLKPFYLRPSAAEEKWMPH